ncbi:hypothetical protein [Hyella patelloides]|uniref:hypothetical protein n=1 Tax=Hyella patelloides TaxID=1982969 RepID=UPI0011A83313|nr:hypothetical protein [Hyella patelloides]
MATAKSQAKWYERSLKGLVALNPICPVCNKRCRADSSKAPYHTQCWRKTDEGREYMREMKRKSREKL